MASVSSYIPGAVLAPSGTSFLQVFMFISSLGRPTRACSLLLLFLVLEGRPAFAGARALTSVEFPRTLKADPTLVPKVEQMLAASPTFREQCLRIDEADRLVVLLRINPLLPRDLFRARSTVKRYSSGLMVVDVEVAAGADQAEWIAHEFEHVLEMIEGRNLQRLAREQAPGVWRSVDRMIETSRATDAGRSVLSETQSVDVLDKFVE